jgi:hypothetical protein
VGRSYLIFTGILRNLDVGAVNCAEEECAVQGQLHVGLADQHISTSFKTITHSTGCFSASSTDLDRDIAGRDQDLRNGHTVHQQSSESHKQTPTCSPG